jgi:CspA family cold shock protein
MADNSRYLDQLKPPTQDAWESQPYDDRNDTMTKGTVKWFNTAKGYGFIAPEDGSKDAFVHISALERAGISSLQEGQKVQYELQKGRNGKSSAENIQLID